MAGGTAHGKEGGIARVIITQVGNTIEARPRFIVTSPITGGTTTGKDIGADNNGTFNQYLMLKSKGIGEAGKRIIIGKKIEPGALRICNDKGTRDTRLIGAGEIIQTAEMIAIEINASQPSLQ
jgi:hypothetical protein